MQTFNISFWYLNILAFSPWCRHPCHPLKKWSSLTGSTFGCNASCHSTESFRTSWYLLMPLKASEIYALLQSSLVEKGGRWLMSMKESTWWCFFWCITRRKTRYCVCSLVMALLIYLDSVHEASKSHRNGTDSVEHNFCKSHYSRVKTTPWRYAWSRPYKA